MANEVRVNASLIVKKNNLDYRSNPTTFQADLTIAKGPTPGAILATTEGVDVDLSELTSPGYCFIQNLDQTNFVMVGIWEPDSSLFYPLMDIDPGEFCVFKISKWLSEQFQATGTGTGTSNNTMRIKADTEDCIVVVAAFDR